MDTEPSLSPLIPWSQAVGAIDLPTGMHEAAVSRAGRGNALNAVDERKAGLGLRASSQAD